MKKESKPTKSMPYFNEAKNFIIIEKDNIKNMFKTESIAFAEFLKADFEMADGANGDIYIGGYAEQSKIIQLRKYTMNGLKHILIQFFIQPLLPNVKNKRWWRIPPQNLIKSTEL